MKILFEIRRYNGQNVIFINDQLFDWAIDEESLEEIKKIKSKEELENINESIKNYFLDCLESTLNKKITIKQVLEGLKLGHIEL